MKRFLFAAALAAAATPAMAADVGVSISVGQPGFYGRIDIGDFPRPAVIYAEPMIIQQAPWGVVRRPIYLRVPPGHAKNWAKHCHKYNACAQPVYFVQERWYSDVYAPRYRETYRYREQQRYEGRDRRDGYDRRDGGDPRRADRDRGRGNDKKGGNGGKGDRNQGRGRN